MYIKNIVILVSVFTANISIGMEDRATTVFANPINRFAITSDGSMLVTSENEHLVCNDVWGMTLRMWMKSDSGEYHEQVKRFVCVDSPQFALRWLQDKSRLAIMRANKDNNVRAKISYRLLNPTTLNDNDVNYGETRSRPFKETELDELFEIHGADRDSFRVMGETFRSVEKILQEGFSVRVTPNELCLRKTTEN